MGIVTVAQGQAKLQAPSAARRRESRADGV